MEKLLLEFFCKIWALSGYSSLAVTIEVLATLAHKNKPT